MSNDIAYVRDYLDQGLSPALAFQAAIDFMFAQHGGGLVVAPPGNFVFDRPVTQKGGTIVQGAGRNGGTFITSAGVDISLWVFDSTASRACLRDVFFAGRTERDAQHNVMSIAENVQVFIRDCDIWGGNAALFNKGTDCRIRDCFISGNGLACLVTNGANFYDHVKFDTADNSTSPQWSVYIGSPTQTLQDSRAMENFFNVCDMSGAWRNGSIFIDDSQSAVGSISYNQFIGGVISGAVTIARAKQSIFTGVRFGTNSFTNNGGSVSVASCTSLVSLILPGNVERGTGNINIGGGSFG